MKRSLIGRRTSRVVCAFCGAEFDAALSEIKKGRGRLCSLVCRDKAKAGGLTHVERFWRSVDKSGDCWVWTGRRQRFGYGRFTYTVDGLKTQVDAHRFSWTLAFGPIPAGLWVLHKCDNPSCVNSAHLFLGDRSTNNRDAASKGRLGRRAMNLIGSDKVIGISEERNPA